MGEAGLRYPPGLLCKRNLYTDTLSLHFDVTLFCKFDMDMTVRRDTLDAAPKHKYGHLRW